MLAALENPTFLCLALSLAKPRRRIGSLALAILQYCGVKNPKTAVARANWRAGCSTSGDFVSPGNSLVVFETDQVVGKVLYIQEI